MNNITKQQFANRRDKLVEQISNSAVVILTASREQVGGYPVGLFRQNSDFYYLTGFAEPEAVAVIIPGRIQGEYVLFCRERILDEEIWNGHRAGQVGACKDYGADQAFPIKQFASMLPDLLANRDEVYTNFGEDQPFDLQLLDAIKVMNRKNRTGINPPLSITHIGKITNEMRIRKNLAEIAIMQKSADIAVEAHFRAMRACRPGLYENELEAEIIHEYTKSGGFPSFEVIVGAGGNSCVLHYVYKNRKILDGDIVLVDSGIEYQHYCSDITRTYPANGKFTPEQRAIYQAVLNTQMAVTDCVRPNILRNELQEVSERIVAQELLKLGILHGTLSEVLETKAHKQFYMHMVGHWLGMDDHDVGDYKVASQWRQLEPGMVLTVEPGIYIPANSPNVDPSWWNIGVRIEDDIVVTETGHTVLSEALPKTIDELEKIVGVSRQ
jgi:Xaa-Pro aminopeptidase